MTDFKYNAAVIATDVSLDEHLAPRYRWESSSTSIGIRSQRWLGCRSSHRLGRS
jgi:hypothetical protein